MSGDQPASIGIGKHTDAFQPGQLRGRLHQRGKKQPQSGAEYAYSIFIINVFTAFFIVASHCQFSHRLFPVAQIN